MSDDLWIVIPNWERFQHYKNRNPLWIKSYLELMGDDAYLGLTFHQRGVLQGIWLEYARARRQLLGSTSSLSRRLGGRVTTETLEALNHAGFIHFAASKPLAARYHVASPHALAREETEEEQDQESSVQPVARPPALWDGEEPDGLTGELEQSQNGLPDLQHILKEIP